MLPTPKASKISSQLHSSIWYLELQHYLRRYVPGAVLKSNLLILRLLVEQAKYRGFRQAMANRN